MPHLRQRFALQLIEKLAKLWPVVGVLGLRQTGKTTLLQKLLDVKEVVSFDDLIIREEALKSPGTLLEKLTPPVVLDEVQKAPPIFDAIKLAVDRKKIPGSYYLTGSTAFSSKIGIRESLTGRIGLIELFPMCLAELHGKPFKPITQLDMPCKSETKLRFDVIEISKAAAIGGMPVPAFLRDGDQRELYWRSWLETTILRDLSRFFTRGFDPDFAFAILDKIAQTLRNGELPTLKHFPYAARKARVYLEAMEDIFLLRKIVCHQEGIGKEVWLLMDSGLAAYLMGSVLGEGVSLSLVRHFIWNEINTQAEYQGKRFSRIYYKSAQGSPIDFIINNTPFRIVANAADLTQRLDWEARPLHGAMKKLKSKVGYLVGPTNHIVLPDKSGGVGILPWSAWS